MVNGVFPERDAPANPFCRIGQSGSRLVIANQDCPDLIVSATYSCRTAETISRTARSRFGGDGFG
jgi:hypothetical protein